MCPVNVLPMRPVCTGGGQALGVEQSGFDTQALIEVDKTSCETLQFNRPNWNVIEGKVENFNAQAFKGIDLFAGGVPCPPFSVAGKQLGKDDERDLFPEAIRIIEECRPKAVMLENVRGFLGAVFEDYRRKLKQQLESLGYFTAWNLLNASDFGVSQLRPRVVIVALRQEYKHQFTWPFRFGATSPTIGELLYEKMARNGWRQVDAWKIQANDIAPTIVGGSKKHGGGDLGPTRAKMAWASLGVNGKSIADEAPEPDFVGMPRLTVDMVAKIQGFPNDWKFRGKKTPAYRQVGNAFPPPVANAVSSQIFAAITSKTIINLAS